MKEIYLNPIIDSIRTVTESSLGESLIKGELEKLEKITQYKDYAIFMEFDGKIKGKVVLQLEKETAMKIVEKMTGGMGNKEEIDELGESCLLEYGGMIKGNAVSKLNNDGFDCEVSQIKFLKSNDLEETDEKGVLKVNASSDIGELYIQLSVWEK